jgi:hypothetical protein
VKIAEIFAERFAREDLKIPPENLRTRTPGELYEHPLHVSFSFGTDEKGDFLEYSAAHKFTQGEERARIYENGEVVQLPGDLGISVVEDREAESDLDRLSDDELLRLWRRIQTVLRSRDVCRGSNIVADVAERLVAQKLGLALAPQSTRGYDAVAPDGTRFQIKGRLTTTTNPSRQLGDIHYLDEDRPFDQLIAVLFGDEFPEPLAVYRLPLALVKQAAQHRRHRRVLVLTPSILASEGVEDLTPQFRLDAASSPLGLQKVRQQQQTSPKSEDRHGARALGVSWVTGQLTRAGFQVATEGRSRLVVSGTGIESRLVQVISASGRIFSVRRKFAIVPGLLLVYVWHVREPERTNAFALTYAEAVALAEAKGWTKTSSWVDEGYYYVTQVGDELLQMLRPYEVLPGRWPEVVAKG